MRELEEELSVPEPRDISPLGLLNDDSNAVGSVHFGVVFKISIPGSSVTVREVDQLEGSFVPCEALGERLDEMETWSRLICEGLKVLS
jgi:predicted NUDIX family phosphoesterase